MTQILQDGTVNHLEQAYARALEEYIPTGGDDSLRTAFEIGRSALVNGEDVFTMAAIHHAALEQLLPVIGSSKSLTQQLSRAHEFFRESISPFDIAHNGLRNSTSALSRLNEALEQEIQRIAHAVHDEAGQLLFAARLAMSEMIREVDPSLQDQLKQIGGILSQAESNLRKLSHELRPTILDDLGLVPALESLAESVASRAGLSIRFHSSFRDRYAQKIETAIYRVAQEALTNVAKHSAAKNVEICLDRTAKHIQCIIHDDGVGFDAHAAPGTISEGGLGLIGIRERLHAVGGTLHINSIVDQGTQMIIEIPTVN